MFTWGGADIVRTGDFRRSYLDVLRAADALPGRLPVGGRQYLHHPFIFSAAACHG